MVFAKTGMKFLIQLFHFFCRKKTFSFSKNLVSLKNEKSFLLSSVFNRKFRRFSPVFANTQSVTRNRHWTIRALNKIRTWINKKKLNPDQICMKTRSEFTFCLTDWKKSELTQHEFSITTAFHSKKLTENVRE